MKKTIISIILLVVALSATAQEKPQQNGWKREGKTFVQSAEKSQTMRGDTPTTYKWRDKDGKEYPIILHRYTKGEKAGRTTAYVIRISKKSGKEYRYFLPDGEKIANEIINETK